MGPDRTRQGFEDTNWSLIRELRAPEAARRKAALSILVETYQGPVYAYLRQLGCDPEHATELMQRFFVEKVLGGGLFVRADERRARLRVLLKTALKRFRIDDHRRQATHGHHLVELAARLEREERVLPRTGNLSPEDAFQRRWASTVLEEAMRRCRGQYVARGRSRQWEAFYARTVRPILSGAAPPRPADIAEEVGLASASEVAQAVFEVRRRMQTLMREVAAETVDDPATAAAEIRELLDTLGVG